MSVLWVFVEALSAPGPIELAPEEARHVAARRLRVGDGLLGFDGAGRTAELRLERIGKGGARVEVGAIRRSPRPQGTAVVASAIPRSERLGTMLQMLTQIGVAAWQPLVLEDSVVRKLDPEAKRISRILVESCKVARRPWLLDVRPPCSLEAALAGRTPGSAVFFGDRAGSSAGLAASTGLVLIGPEAGFSPSERRILEAAGARPRSFAAHNLRIETAAVAAAVALHLAGLGRATPDEGGEVEGGSPGRRGGADDAG
ncbi:MAG TPA: 16S rRNA (uracil(1498)-N(3))-methyltransferase [Deltaproteobacteria bacterium]|nr:16S rRNA (uracil(1498)-N(3))-methyltransferase [Deltaproteobacteria bacterium]